MAKPQGKTELISVLAVLLRNFVLGHHMSHDFEMKRELSNSLTFYDGKGGSETVDIGPLWTDAKTGEQVPFDKALEQFKRSLARAIIAESHEAIQLYCTNTDQFQKYRDSDLYRFCRIMRHVVSHGGGGVLGEWPKNFIKRGITEIEWRDRKLDVSMVGSSVGFNNLEVVRLIKDMIEFIIRELD